MLPGSPGPPSPMFMFLSPPRGVRCVKGSWKGTQCLLQEMGGPIEHGICHLICLVSAIQSPQSPASKQSIAGVLLAPPLAMVFVLRLRPARNLLFLLLTLKYEPPRAARRMLLTSFFAYSTHNNFCFSLSCRSFNVPRGNLVF